MIRDVKDLRVYKQSHDLALRVENTTKSLPRYEWRDIGSQMRRAARSIPANIAEGYGKKRSVKEFKMFITNAVGSCSEMLAHLEFARDSGKLDRQDCEKLIEGYTSLIKQLYTLRRNWRTF
jgi:four helix bundle protein